MSKQFKLEWSVSKCDQTQLLREFLIQQNISKTALTDIKFRGGKIEVNGQQENVRYVLKESDHIVLTFPIENISESMVGENIPFKIQYEDDYVLVVEKPARMNTIPSREHPTGSLANALIYYYQQNDIYATTHIVTRLDRDTSGLLLIAKHRHIHHLFSQSQQAGKVKRQYEAIVQGLLQKKEGMIEAPIARKPTSIIERVVDTSGQYACTLYQVVNFLNDMTHVKLELKTGRTHQIRVHMAHIGHPLIGDSLYGGPTDLLKRQALHCCYLQFTHPITNEVLLFQSNLPSDMENLFKREEN